MKTNPLKSIAASLLATALVTTVVGCGSSVGNPVKSQAKADVEKKIVGVYQQVYETDADQEAANIQNDLSRPEGVSPGKTSFYFCVLPNGKTYSWKFNDRLRLVTLSNFSFEDMGSYSLQNQTDGSWAVNLSCRGREHEGVGG